MTLRRRQTNEEKRYKGWAKKEQRMLDYFANNADAKPDGSWFASLYHDGYRKGRRDMKRDLEEAA